MRASFWAQEMDQETAKSLFDYDPDTGVIRNKTTRSSTAIAGDISGCSCKDGYIVIFAKGHRYYAHRLAWLIMTGEFPAFHIDHVNGIRSDNSFRNLRSATNAQNSANRKLERRNSSGHKGVYWNSERSTWKAVVRKGRKFLFQKSFNTLEEAAKAAAEAREKFHGEFARHE